MSKLDYQIVEKGWGREIIFVNNDKYCGKILRFNKDSRFSMHFHIQKTETWYISKGRFILNLINTDNATISNQELNTGDVIHIKPGVPHQLHSLDEGEIFEVSTPDYICDSYRVFPGDSQTK